MKNIRIFLSANFHFLVVNFLVYLNRHVCNDEAQISHGPRLATSRISILFSSISYNY